jgi:hypothetical protein
MSRRIDPKPGGRNPEVDFRDEKRSNATHRSTTDPDARLAKKGNTAAKLCYTASTLMENRNGLIVDTEVEHVTGTAERDSALAMLERQPKRKKRRTVGADKLYDTKDFVAGCRELDFTPHVARAITDQRGSAINGRTTPHEGYKVSQRKRKLVEQGFGWDKTIGAPGQATPPSSRRSSAGASSFTRILVSKSSPAEKPRYSCVGRAKQ